MIVWSTIEASCPICSNRTRLREVGSGFVQGQDSDLLVRMGGKHIIQAEIHTCNKCRFSGYASDFVRTISPPARTRFIEEVAPTLVDDPGSTTSRGLSPQKTPLPDVQYHWAARTAEALGLPACEQADRWVRAYWCLRLAPSSYVADALKKSLKKLYLTRAISRLRQGLRSDRDRNRVFLVGELSRRNNNFLMASHYLRRFVERENGAPYLKAAALKLLELSQKRVSQDLTLEEVLYGAKPGKAKPGNSTPDVRPRGGTPGDMG